METDQRLGWRQLVLPLVVLVAVFGWLLPNLIDYAAVWEAMASLTISADLVLLTVGLAWTWVEAGIYTSLIPGLRPYPGWKAFMGGNSVAGFAPAPWDMLVRYAMYRGFGVASGPAAASIITSGIFTLGIKYLAPAVVLASVVVTTEASGTLVAIAVTYTVLLGVIVAVVAALLRKEAWAAWVGRVAQRVVDWLFRVIRRPPKGGLEAGLVEFRRTVVDSLSSRWPRPTALVLASHTVQFLGMLFIFRQLGIGPDVVPTPVLLGTYGLGIFMSMMPIVPGGLGAVELTYVWVLARDDDALANEVAAAAFAHRVFFWLIPILVGLIPLISWVRSGGTLAALGKGGDADDAGPTLTP